MLLLLFPRRSQNAERARAASREGGWGEGSHFFTGRFQPGNGGLLHARDGELVGRRVLGQRGAGAERGAAADGDRRHQLRIGADEDVVLDHRAVLVGAVVVAGDGAGADVDVPADGGIADIGEVVGLGAVGHRAVLHFDEVADVHVLAELRAGAQARVGADDAAAAGLGLLDVAEGGDARAGADDGIPQHAMRADLDAVAEHDAALEHAVHVDRHVAAAVELAAHVEPVGVEQGHALLHQQQRIAVLVDALQFGQLHLAVHAEHFPGLVGLGRHRHALADRQPDDVGQVVLALRVVVAQRRQPAPERRGRRGDEAGVDLADGAFLVRGVALLDDAQDVAVVVAHDAAVAARIVQVLGQHAEAAAGRFDQTRQGGAPISGTSP
jgi:hypothetical protein